MMLARLGEHRDVVTNAFSKCAPADASLSMFGVLRKLRILGFP
jgi:hypothetical protein